MFQNSREGGCPYDSVAQFSTGPLSYLFWSVRLETADCGNHSNSDLIVTSEALSWASVLPAENFSKWNE